MNIIASSVLFKHSYKDIQPTLRARLIAERISLVVIVDNGGHCDWLNSFKNEKVEVIRTPVNHGFGAGHNAVFKKFHNTTEYFLICNPDVTFENGEVNALYAFSQRGNVGLAIPKVIYPDGSHQFACKLLPQPCQLFLRRFFIYFSPEMNHRYELRDADYGKEFFAPFLSGCFVLLSHEALMQTNGFDERFFLYMEDVDLSRRVCQSGLPVRYCPDAKVIHEAQSRSYRSLKFLYYHMKSAVRYFNKWGWLKDRERDNLNAFCLSALPKIKNEESECRK